ncbi:MAG: hypothetical protein HOH33_14350 [Verrucomicrobia bacterium]|jgi:2-keto-4-pentenoate hydratase|nr:hypothetical protein [Verrucomicrobiota bacterium]
MSHLQHSNIEKRATQQLADYDRRQPGTLFADGLRLDVNEGYALQTAVTNLRRSRGEQVIGYKVGCTSPKIRAQLGLDHCISGRLFDSEQFLSGEKISRKSYANLAIEGELAVELSREPVLGDFNTNCIPSCVARVFPVIELHHLLTHSQHPSAGEMIAHNALHAGVIAGKGATPCGSYGHPSMSIYMHDQLLEHFADMSLLTTIGISLRWLFELLCSRGERLSAGHVVLTGSILGLMPIQKACRLRVESNIFGSVETTIL